MDSFERVGSSLKLRVGILLESSLKVEWNPHLSILAVPFDHMRVLVQLFEDEIAFGVLVAFEWL